MHSLLRFTLALCVTVLTVTPCFQVTAQEACRRVEISGPSWISSIAADDGRILVTDPAQRRILAYNEENEVVMPAEDLEASLEGEIPVGLVETSDGLLVKTASARGVWVGPDAKGRMLLGTDAATGQSSGIGALLTWAVHDDCLVGYGSVRNMGSDLVPIEKPFKLGFLSASLSSSRGVHGVKLLQALDDQAYYLRGLQMVAATSAAVHYLAMENRPTIYRVSDDCQSSQDLSAMPQKFHSTPELKVRSTGPASVPAVYEEMETLRAPVGIYGHADGPLVYLLTREPSDGSGTSSWLIHRIDPEADKVVGEAVRLPTSAPHIHMIVTTEKVYIFEQGHVRAWGNQPTESLVVLPTAWLDDTESSVLRASQPHVNCEG